MNGTKLVSGLTAALGAWLIAQNVGIGTSSPDSRLHVHNPSGTPATRVGHFENLNDAGNNNGVLIRTARAGTDAYILDARSGTGAAPASRLYVRADGNVGIGTTSPDFGLDVEKGTGRTFAKFGNHHPLYVTADRPNIGFNLYFDNNWRFGKGSAGHYGGVISVDPATGNMSIHTSNSGNAGNTATLTERVTILQNGNVGIGVTNPGFGLDVEKGTGYTFAKFGNHHPLYVTADRPNIGFNLYFDNNWRFGKGSMEHYGGVISVNPATGTMSIFTSNSGNAGNVATLTERVTILQNGNVGIGWTNPTVRLEVAGRGLADYGWETKVHFVTAQAGTDLGTQINNLLNVYDCVCLVLPRNTTWTWNTQVFIRGGKSLVIIPANWQWGETYRNTGVVINITQPVIYDDGVGACWLGQQTKDVSKLILGNGARATITGVRINVSICDNRPYHCWGNTRGIFGLNGGGAEFTGGAFTNRAGESDTKLILSHVTIVTTEPVLAAGLYSIGYVWFVGVPDPNNTNDPNANNPLGIFRAGSCASTPNPLRVIRTDNGWDNTAMGCFVFVNMRPLWLKSGTNRVPGALTLSSGSGWVIYSD